jgi:hypothetical protein
MRNKIMHRKTPTTIAVGAVYKKGTMDLRLVAILFSSNRLTMRTLTVM